MEYTKSLRKLSICCKLYYSLVCFCDSYTHLEKSNGDSWTRKKCVDLTYVYYFNIKCFEFTISLLMPKSLLNFAFPKALWLQVKYTFNLVILETKDFFFNLITLLQLNSTATAKRPHYILLCNNNKNITLKTKKRFYGSF